VDDGAARRQRRDGRRARRRDRRRAVAGAERGGGGAGGPGAVDGRRPLASGARRRPIAAMTGEVAWRLPHNWEAALWHEGTTGTLFCSDLFTQLGECPPTTTGDIVAPAIATEERSRFVPVTADTGPALRRLADLAPPTLALIHGPTFVGEPPAPLTALSEHHDARL